jgi:DNA-binding NarL/FixJ family response regulator
MLSPAAPNGRETMAVPMELAAATVPSAVAAVRVVVGIPHERLRDALADWLERTGHIAVVGRAADSAASVRAARELGADVVVLGKAIVGEAAGTPLRDVLAALGDIPLVIVGLDGSRAYAAAFREAGTADYLVLDTDMDGLAGALWRAARSCPRA